MSSRKAFAIVTGVAFQFIDFEVDPGRPLSKHAIAIAKKPFCLKMPEGQERKTVPAPLEPNTGVAGENREMTGPDSILPVHCYCEHLFSFQLEAWLRLPVPIFTRQALNACRSPLFSGGLTEWCRVRVSAPGEPDSLAWNMPWSSTPRRRAPRPGWTPRGAVPCLARFLAQ
ncbi:MAG: hypothetical protein LBT40_09360 [Deltaproteobacteria bacterium]|jgi:hypothetical protein|nr:hypothetical protein [Deltaproteobacteria bacterium]